MTFPLLRVLLTFFILLPIISFSLYTFILKKSFFLDLGAKMAGEEVPYEIVSAGEKQAKQPNTYNNSGSNENKNSGEQETQDDSVAEKIDIETNSQTNNEDQKIIFHTVQPNETLYSIALKYYHSKSGIDLIKQWNDLSNDGIIVGQVLEIHLP
jgi:LysM repeat protein